MSTLNYILHIKSWGLYFPEMLLTTTETFNTSLFTSPKSYTAFYSLIHWQESETHFISKKKKLHFNYWRSLNKSIIISRMYIYTTTTNCPLATQPPPWGIRAHSQIQNWVPKFIEGGLEVSKSTKLPNFVFLKWC